MHAVKQDKMAFIDSFAKKIDSAVCKGDAKEVSQALRPFAGPSKRRADPKRPRPIPIWLAADGTVTQSFAEAQEAWREHCAKLEVGFAVEATDAVTACALRQNEASHDPCIDSKDLVTFIE